VSEQPTTDDLLAIASFADRFDEPGFVAGEWVSPEPTGPGHLVIGYWMPSETVVQWTEALYDHHIIDPESDYLGEENADSVRRAIHDPSLVADLDLHALRRVLTFLARAERFSDGGWYEEAFESGMAQAATRRLGELADADT
jgi:hypothetical protein